MFEKFRDNRRQRAEEKESAEVEKAWAAGIFPWERQRFLPATIYVPTPEWIDPYAGISEEEKRIMESQFEPPLIPSVEISDI